MFVHIYMFNTCGFNSMQKPQCLPSKCQTERRSSCDFLPVSQYTRDARTNVQFVWLAFQISQSKITMKKKTKWKINMDNACTDLGTLLAGI